MRKRRSQSSFWTVDLPEIVKRHFWSGLFRGAIRAGPFPGVLRRTDADSDLVDAASSDKKSVVFGVFPLDDGHWGSW